MAVEGFENVDKNLERWKKRMVERAELAMQMVMAALEGWAKAEHKWGNPYSLGYTPTGNLANSIRGQVAEVSETMVRGVLSAGMDYAVFVELAHDGRWAWLWPVVITHKKDILKIIKDVMGGKSSLSTAVSANVHSSFQAFKTQRRANARNAHARANPEGSD